MLIPVVHDHLDLGTVVALALIVPAFARRCSTHTSLATHQSDNADYALILIGLAKYALSAGQPVNSVLDGVLPIHAACAGGSDAVVRLLLSNGADVNAVRCGGLGTGTFAGADVRFRLPRKKPHRHKLDKLASPTSLKGSSLAMAGTSASGYVLV